MGALRTNTVFTNITDSSIMGAGAHMWCAMAYCLHPTRGEWIFCVIGR
jgi:hypothetical protein